MHEAAAGLHGGTQRMLSAHGRTAQGLPSIIGSAGVGHIACLLADASILPPACVVAEMFVPQITQFHCLLESAGVGKSNTLAFRHCFKKASWLRRMGGSASALVLIVWVIL